MSLSRVFKWLCPLALVVVAYAATRAGTPEDAVKAFFDAWNGRDLAKAAGMVVGAKPSADFKALQEASKGDWPKITLSSATSESKGDKATVKVVYTVSAKSYPNEDVSEEVNLVNAGDHWLIVPVDLQQAATEKKYIGMLANMLTQPEMLTVAKRAAKMTVCLSNLKQLAVGLTIFAADNDDVIKLDLSRAKKTLYPYIKNDDVWYCPELGKSKVAYSINPKMVNVPMTTPDDPAHTILIYEGSKGKLDFRHNGKAGVAFVDTSAKMVTPEEAKKLRWK